MSLIEYVQDAMRESKNITPDDYAACQLALRYANLIDDAEDKPDEVKIVSDLGPKLEAVLNDLCLTPRGRRMPAKNTEPAGEVNPSDTPRGQVIALRARFGRPGARQPGA